jgi:hypothetical protein
LGVIGAFAGALLLAVPQAGEEHIGRARLVAANHATLPGVNQTRRSDPAATPGWVATFSSGDAEALSIVGHASFAAETGESVHPAIAPAGFTAVYNTTLQISEPGEYRFGAEVEGGRLELSIFGGDITRPIGLSITGDAPRGRYTRAVDLPIGEVRLRYEFSRNGDAPARLRAMWSKDGLGVDGFKPEPIPVASASPTLEEADRAASLDRGRVLLGELGCVNCHAAEGGAARPARER